MKNQVLRKPFTLIEIMTVIVIAAILFGIGIPAFTTMIQGSSMTAAIRQLSAKIQAARAYAVTHRCKVALLLVETESGNLDYRYSAYRVCVVDSSNAFQEWIEDENWKTLPKGVLRAKILESDKFESITIDISSLGGSNSVSVYALVFKDNGQLTKASPKIRLIQGRYVGGTKPVAFTERTGDGKIINHPIEVNQYSGKVKVCDIDEKTDKQMDPED